MQRLSRLTGIGAAGAAAALLLAGCNGDDSAGNGGGGSTASAAASGEQSASGAASPSGSAGGQDAVDVVQATNKKTTDAGSAHVQLATEATTAGKSVTVTGTGVIDLRNGTSRLLIGESGRQVEQRVVDQVLYEKPPAGTVQMPSGKTWLKIDLAKLGAAQGAGADGSGVSDPAGSFAYTKSLSEKDVTVVGKENVNGAPTTHYRVALDLGKLAKGDAAQEKKLRAQLGDNVPVDLWIDAQGRTRREQIELTVSGADAPSAATTGASASAQQAKAKVVMNFSDFGTDVKVTAPAAKDAVDFTDKLAGKTTG
ncbi:hypothetical protein ACIQU5_22060 [Streptomyces sp. NPDC090306]|uniref:hypothetical protein n=1 Tax=Streptomyces sp. NPDC090306 TaxID=3365961 RepID=UPI00381DB023